MNETELDNVEWDVSFDTDLQGDVIYIDTYEPISLTSSDLEKMLAEL